MDLTPVDIMDLCAGDEVVVRYIGGTHSGEISGKVVWNDKGSGVCWIVIERGLLLGHYQNKWGLDHHFTDGERVIFRVTGSVWEGAWW